MRIAKNNEQPFAAAFRLCGLTRRRLALLLAAATAAACAPGETPHAPALPVDVFAAASLTEALAAAAEAFAHAEAAQRPRLNFAASSALARQIEQGAHADLFVSADEEWMDYLAERNLVAADGRVTLLTNGLVIIAPAASTLAVTLAPNLDLRRALGDGRLAIADPDGVPAGRYARAALQHFGAWTGVEDRLALGENVRAALRFVETGEAAAGIVYRTDALAAGDRVRVVAAFPAASHPPIRYPAALIGEAPSEAARAFFAYLRSAPAAEIFQRFGFGMVQ
ncbi:MAG: molybdate ABC transporter substrate-binding protein [Hyphomonadaceae bacterium]